MKSLSFAALLFTALLALTGCSGTANDGSPIAVESFQAMGTTVHLEAQGERAERQSAIEDARAEVERLAALFDAHTEESDIARLNAKRQITAEDDTVRLLTQVKTLSAATEGRFASTIAPLRTVWQNAASEGRTPTEDELTQCLSLVNDNLIWIDGDSIALPAAVTIDVSRPAQGYIADRVIEIFEAHDLERGLIAFGGAVDENAGTTSYDNAILVNTFSSSPDNAPWNLFLADPADSSLSRASFLAYNEAVATAGGYQTAFEAGGSTVHSFLDPETGQPVSDGLGSVSVVCDSAFEAAALSEALLIMGESAATDYWRAHTDDFEAIFMSGDLTGSTTRDHPRAAITEGIDAARFALVDDSGGPLISATDERPTRIAADAA